MHFSPAFSVLLLSAPTLISAHTIVCHESTVKAKRDDTPLSSSGSPAIQAANRLKERAEIPVGGGTAGTTGNIPYVILDIDNVGCTGLTDTAGSCGWDPICSGGCKLSGPGWCGTPGATASMKNGVWTLKDDTGYQSSCKMSHDDVTGLNDGTCG